MMTLERDPCSKIILTWIILIGILSHSRYQCERSAQWEKSAEVTLGHSRTVKGNESQDSYDLVRQFIRIDGHIYIGLFYWTDYG